MLRIVQDALRAHNLWRMREGGRPRRATSSWPSALEAARPAPAGPPAAEPLLEHRAGSAARAALGLELTALCRGPDTLPLVVGAENCDAGECRSQSMPFDHRRVAAYFHHAWAGAVFERAAELLAGEHRQRVIAAAMLGQAMTAIQAEYNLCRLVDHLRFGCYFLRELTRSRYVVQGQECARNCNQYHGLEGFWAAITPHDSVSTAAQLAITPAMMGNTVLWKPSDYSILACHRVMECLLSAGLPPGVINFVSADEDLFLDTIMSGPHLAGVAFAGTTDTLELIWKRVAENVEQFARFPRIVGTGSGKNFHIVHSSAHLATAVACTVRAAFEMGGQKATSCSRVYVAESLLGRFVDSLACTMQSLVVCHPLDYRCFTSSLVSLEAFEKVSGLLARAQADPGVQLVCGGRADAAVGWFVEPALALLRDARHELLLREARGPLLAVVPFPDCELEALVWAVAQSPYAIAGSVFAQDVEWARWAVGALRDLATGLYVNERCSEERPPQQSLGGTRRSGTGAKAGSMSYLLQFASERSLSESLRPCCDVTYPYMDECPPCFVWK